MTELHGSFIKFDNFDGAYKPGETVSGHIELNLNSPKTVKGVSIKILGEAKVEWSETESTTNSDGSSSNNTVYYTNREIYFKEKYYVISNKDGNNVEIAAGQHIYPFKYTLPRNIPQSFQHRVGKITYSVKITLERPWKINKYLLQPFNVNTFTTVCDNPLASKPGLLNLEKRFGLLIKSKPMRAVIRTQNSGFMSGQNIPLSFDINNESDIKIMYITVKLQQMFKFYSQSCSKNEKVILARCQIADIIPSKSSTKFTRNLYVPLNITSLIPDLSNCKIIDCFYQIRVKLCTSGFTTNLSGEFPVYPITGF